MRNLIFSVFCLLFFVGCKKQNNQQKYDITEKRELAPELDKEERLTFERIDKLRELEMDSLWNVLKERNGCLTGAQYSRNGKFGREGCVMDNSEEWEVFYEKPKKELANFLITKFNKKDTTNVHTCPFFSATEGELAVYAIQRVANINWTDFKDYNKYLEKTKDSTLFIKMGNSNTLQAYLNDSVLSKPKEIKTLKSLFLNELN